MHFQAVIEVLSRHYRDIIETLSRADRGFVGFGMIYRIVCFCRGVDGLSQKSCKYTTNFSYVQTRVYFFFKKVTILCKNAKF